MKLIERTTWRGETPWTISVLLLSLPSFISMILHEMMLHEMYVPGTLPWFLDLLVVWTGVLTVMFGPLLTLAAFVVSVIATFQTHIPRKAKVAMWAFVSLSFLACLYLSRVPL
jgi:hypothetical protein